MMTDKILPFPRQITIIEEVTIEQMAERMDYIQTLRDSGEFDAKCDTCNRLFLPELLQGKKFHDIMAPRHHGKAQCKSGMQDHCTCDICF